MTLTEAKKLVFEQKPIFAKLYEEYKNKTWMEYAGKNYPHPDPSSRLRRTQDDTLSSWNDPARSGRVIGSQNDNELIKILENVLSPLLPRETVTQAISSLKKTRFVSSADHCGILCHPFFSNSTLLRGLVTDKKDAIISFSCGGISLSNSSLPRSIFFHDRALREIKISLIPHASRNRPVYGYPAISRKKFEQGRKKIKSLNIPRSRLIDFFDTILEDSTLWSLDNASEQFTRINYILWNTLFGGDVAPLITIEAEQIV